MFEQWGLSESCQRGSYVPPGWQAHVNAMMQELAGLPGWSPLYIQQLKVKFGTFQVYYQLPDESLKASVEAIVARTLHKLDKTCMQCGGYSDDVECSACFRR